jgi:hypothetical protein
MCRYSSGWMRRGCGLVAPSTGVVLVAVSRFVSLGAGMPPAPQKLSVTTAAPAAAEPASSDGYCVWRPPAKRAAPILRGSRPEAAAVRCATIPPSAAQDEPCAPRDCFSNHIRIQRFTVRERGIPGLGENSVASSRILRGETGAVCAPLRR